MPLVHAFPYGIRVQNCECHTHSWIALRFRLLVLLRVSCTMFTQCDRSLYYLLDRTIVWMLCAVRCPVLCPIRENRRSGRNTRISACKNYFRPFGGRFDFELSFSFKQRRAEEVYNSAQLATKLRTIISHVTMNMLLCVTRDINDDNKLHLSLEKTCYIQFMYLAKQRLITNLILK